jgi:hypothetical protein
MKAMPLFKNFDFKNQAPRIAALGLLAALLLRLEAGCSSGADGTTGAGSTSAVAVAGEYKLISVNGQTLPGVVAHEGADITIKSGAMTFATNGTCQSRSVFSLPQGHDVNRVVDATYTLSGTNVTMHWKRAGTTWGNFHGGAFVMNNEGMIFSYQK